MTESLAMNFSLFAASGRSSAALITFFVYSAIIFALAWFSHQVLSKRRFLSEYFLGSRGLGVIAFTLTYGATSASVGSFAGFPALIYAHGWVLALWIASYMVVPLCGMGLIGKRLNQIARKTGAITVPDVLRERFGSSAVGLLATIMIIFMLSFYLIPQFKIASIIVQQLLADVPFLHQASLVMAGLKESVPWLQGVDLEYLVCLLMFAVMVVIYTTFGGFRAVVWTDVLQGFVMIGGVLVMLGLALWQVGGLGTATKKLAKMTPPELGRLTFHGRSPASSQGYRIDADTWFTMREETSGELLLIRTNQLAIIPPGKTISNQAKVVRITTPEEISAISKRFPDGVPPPLPEGILPSLVVSSLVIHTESPPRGKSFQVPSKTWLLVTDSQSGNTHLLQTQQAASILPSTVRSNKVSVVEVTDPDEIEKTMAEFTDGTPPPLPPALRPELIKLQEYAYGAGKRGVYVTGPGPSPDIPYGFHPFGMVFSFFFFWALSGTGQPGNMVRLMAFDSCRTLRRSICLLAVYFGLIYFPLVIIFCCARVLAPGLDQDPDRIMPVMAFTLSEAAHVPWLAGVLVAAPFAAAMSTVDSFMLMISSSVVRDVYQHHVNPDAPERTMRRLSYLCMVIVGVIATLGAVNPPKFLQYLIVFTGGGLGVTFLIPMVMAMYWPRVNTPGIIAAMSVGFLVYLGLYVANLAFYEAGDPLRPLGLHPLLWGFATSALAGIIVSLSTAPLPAELVNKFFYREP